MNAKKRILTPAFYQRHDVVRIASELLGMVLETRIDGKRCSGRIVETEAYNGIADKASHAAGGRRTRRNEVMYAIGGVTYVYLCYGIHHLFNVVTSIKDDPHAVLIRALEPLEGIPFMLERTGKKKPDHTLTRGPGNLSRAMGVSIIHSGVRLNGQLIRIYDDGFRYTEKQIAASPRIGVAYAGEDALLPYRFYIKGNQFVSGKPNK